MNYLSVPNSDLKLVDGTVVMLYRLPGLKWVLHNGWYNYNGKQYRGWYFSSIPSQTILPVSNEDLRMITVVADDTELTPPCPPGPPFPPGPYPGPPSPIFPPVPPDPDIPRPAFFSKDLEKQLLSAFITVSNPTKLDELDTSRIPSGKIVRVNSEDKYYIWSQDNETWSELEFATGEAIEEAIEEALNPVVESLEQTRIELDTVRESVGEVKRAVDDVEEDLATLQSEFDAVTSDLEHRADILDQKTDALQESIEFVQAKLTDYEVKTVVVEGDGTFIADAVLDPISGVLTLTRGTPAGGAMHFLGISSTPITDGGREHPKINGIEKDTSELFPGDVVLYSPDGDTNYLEFVWCLDETGTGHWSQIGDEASYVPKTRRVEAGDGLSGGGSLENDIILSHGPTGTGESTTLNIDGEGIQYVSGVEVDQFGHVQGLVSKSVSKEELLETLGYKETTLTFVSNGNSVQLTVLAKRPQGNGGV